MFSRAILASLFVFGVGVVPTVRGFRNPEHFKIAIYFQCGGLDLYPHESR